MQTIHRIEPELQGPIPRRIRLRTRIPTAGLACLGCLLLFLLPFVLIGMGLVGGVFSSTGLLLIGRTTTGYITHRASVSGDDGDSYSVDYTYRVDGKEYKGRDSVEQEVYDNSNIGWSTSVKYFPFAPGIYSIALLPDRTEIDALESLLFFALFWNGILSVFVFFFWIKPMLYRSVYRRGKVAVATILNKRTTPSHNPTTYTLDYEFQPIERISWRPVKGMETTTAEEFAEINPGDAFTVLYHPRFPRFSVLYRFGIYVVIPS